MPAFHSFTQTAPNSMAFLIRNLREGETSLYGKNSGSTISVQHVKEKMRKEGGCPYRKLGLEISAEIPASILAI